MRISFACLAMLLAVAYGATTRRRQDVWLPREIGRFSLPHAAFVEIFQRDDPDAEYVDQLDLVISTFNAGTLVD